MSDTCYTSCGFLGFFGKKTADEQFFERALGIEKAMVNKLVLDGACKTLGTDETKCLTLDYCAFENGACKGVTVTDEDKKDFYDSFCKSWEKETCPVKAFAGNSRVCKISNDDKCVNINEIDPPVSAPPHPHPPSVA